MGKEQSWEVGDVVRSADGHVYERNVRYIDPTFVWRTFEGCWLQDDQVARPLVWLVPEVSS